MSSVEGIERKLDCSGQTVLITGATRGIGAAIADEYARAGARLILTGTKADEVARRRASVTQSGIQWICADFADRSSLDSFLNYIRGLDRLDVLVNNAGVNKIAFVEDVQSGDLDWLLDVNLRAPFLASREAARVMRRRQYGRIVNIASIWSVITKPGRSMYTTAKHGLVGLTMTLALELARDSVLVNAVSPGFTATEMTASTLTTQEIQSLASNVPLGRFASPAEMAAVVQFLGSPRNTYITGQNIVVDGGYTIA